VSRIEAAIRRAHADKRRGAFVPFLTAGYPTPAATVDVALGLAEIGADVLEIGIPFSDPLADGPVIQRSSQAALAAGVTPAQALAMVGEITRQTSTPVVVMTYLNPMLQLDGGLGAAARTAGFAGVILTDLPFDQEHAIWREVDAAGVDPVLLVTPTTPLARAGAIAGRARGFIYCVTRMGVTGTGTTLAAEVGDRVASLRDLTELPVLLGFGIASGDDARRLGQLADGVVVGSALIERLAEARDPVGAAQAFAREVLEGLAAARA
jgi:tryptophan synthase alpha chain